LKNCTEFATLNAMIGFNIIEDFKIEGYKKWLQKYYKIVNIKSNRLIK
jgi:hypothetical protein